MTELTQPAGAPEPDAPTWLSPAPGAAPLPKMIVAQAGLELRTLVRNGEQLLLILIVPVLLLAVFSSEALISVGRGSRIGFIAPGIMALAVMSTSFHGVRAALRRAQAAGRHALVPERADRGQGPDRPGG